MSGLNHNMNHHVNGRITSKVLAPPGGYSSFSIGGYGGAPDISDNKFRGSRSAKGAALNSLNPNVVPSGYNRSSDYAPPQEYDDDRYDARDCAIPGLEEHYSEASQRKNVAARGRFSSGQSGPLSGADYAAQLREQIAMKKQIDREESMRERDRENKSGAAYGGFGTNPRNVQDYRNGNSGEGVSQQQMSVRRAADARHDMAMNSYRNRMESDRERDIRRLQNMDGKAPGSNFLDHKGTRDYGVSAEPQRAPMYPSNSRARAPPGGNSSFSIGWN